MRSGGDDTLVASVNRLHFVDKTDFFTFSRSIAWDGGFSLKYPNFFPGCLSGEYEIQTQKPMSVTGGGFSGGQLHINSHAHLEVELDGTTTLKFDDERLSFLNFFEMENFGGCRFDP